MSKVSTNISLDADLKKAGQELFNDLGLDLSTAVTLFIKQSLRVQGLPFAVTRENPNAETAVAMNEYYAMKENPKAYKRYSSFQAAADEVLADANWLCPGNQSNIVPGITNPLRPVMADPPARAAGLKQTEGLPGSGAK